MASRTLTVQIIGDPSSFTRATRRVSSDATRMGHDVERSGKRIHGFATLSSTGLKRVGVAATGMAAAGGGALALLSKSFITGASDINESLSKNRVLFGDFAKDIEKFSDRSARNFGISKTAALEFTGTFGNLFRSMGTSREESAKFSMNLTKLASDMASFNNTSIEDALEAIRSGLVGESEPLRRFGVNLNDAALRTQALKLGIVDTTKNALTPQQKALATQSLLFKQTSNAQGDFARTSGGLANQSKILKARLADTGAELGSKLLPVALRVVSFLNDHWQPAMDKAGDVVRGVGRATQTARDWIETAVGNIRDTVAKWVDDNRENLLAVRRAIIRLGEFFKDVITNVILPAIRRIAPVLQTMADSTIHIVADLITAVAKLINGDWKGAWEDFKDIPRQSAKSLRALDGIITDAMKESARLAGKLAQKIGIAIIAGIVHGLRQKAGASIKGTLGGILKGATQPFAGVGGDGFGIGEGIGKRVGASMGVPGLGGGALMGADPDLGPFAALGNRFGLHVSSGIRPGAITSSGNQSYHATGDAIDESGSAGGMLSYFRFLKKNFGARLRELIYTPGGVGVKDGKPFRYTGQVAADHFDHVHVAYTGPFGDGPGRVGTVTGSTGGIAGTPQFQRREKARGLLPKWWEAARGFFPAGRRMPPTKFLSNAESGALIYTSQHGRTFFPDWATRGLVKGDDAMFSTLIHEWAHAFQGPSVNTGWKAEGGATAFEKRVVPSIAAKLGMRFNPRGLWGRGNPYYKDTLRVEELGEDWIMRGQFVGGLGRAGRSPFTATAYGPPWNAMNGTGVTATGVNLKSAPHKYGVAVDPSVIPLGSQLKIWPNPFGYRGAFTAFDTGGAIKGNHIDFYDWRGRKAQLGWGSRTVNVSRVGSSGGASAGGGGGSAGNTGAGTGTAIGSMGFGVGKLGGGKNQKTGLGGKAKPIGMGLPGGLDPASGVTDQPSGTDYIDALIAEAGLTATTEDDKAAVAQLVDFFEKDLAGARASGDPRRVTAAASGLKGAREAMEALTGALEAKRRQEEEDRSLRQEQVDNQRKLMALAGQGPQILAAFYAALDGSIGGQAGLGFQTVSYAGAVASY